MMASRDDDDDRAAAAAAGTADATSDARVKHDDAALVSAAEAITRSFLSAEAARARRPLKRKKRQCGCTLSETCHCCHKCIERHCVCGDRARHRSLCLESRACNCVVANPADRCELCRGCRRAQGYSHCRCKQHERQRLQVRAPEAMKAEPHSNDAAATSSDASTRQCRCFSVSAAMLPDTTSSSGSDRSLRIRRLRRAIGVPSVENKFAKKISASQSDEDDAELISAPADESVRSVLHRPLAKRMFPGDAYAPPYQQLHLSDGTSLLESIEPRELRERPVPLILDATPRAAAAKSKSQDEVRRGALLVASSAVCCAD